MQVVGHQAKLEDAYGWIVPAHHIKLINYRIAIVLLPQQLFILKMIR